MKEVQSIEDKEAQPLSNSALSKDFSRVPLSTTKPQQIMTKLTIGAVGDKYEQEANRVAAQVVQRINAPASVRSGEDETLQREEMETKDNEARLMRSPILQCKSSDGGMAATPDLEASINRARSGGQPMADNIRQPMEKAFGADFSGVKIHMDAQANQLNQSIQARAFTTGQNVFFRQGEYNPGSRGGQELLAHELTHVVQQNEVAVQRSLLNSLQQSSASTSNGERGMVQRAFMDVSITHQDEDNGTRVYVKSKNNPDETLGSIKIERPAAGEVQVHTNAAQGVGGQGLGGSLYEKAFEYIFSNNLIPTGNNIVLTILGGAMLHMQTRKLSERFGNIEIYKTAEEAREARKKAAKGQQGHAIDLDRFQEVFLNEHIKYLESLAEEYKKGNLNGLRIKSIPAIHRLFKYEKINKNEDNVNKLLNLDGDILAGMNLEDELLRDLVKDEYIREVTSAGFNGVVFEMSQEFMKKFVGYSWFNKASWLARKANLKR